MKKQEQEQLFENAILSTAKLNSKVSTISSKLLKSKKPKKQVNPSKDDIDSIFSSLLPFHSK